MTESTRLGLGVLLAALVVGTAGDALLRSIPWGINVFSWTSMLVMAAVLLARWRGIRWLGGGRWLGLPALFFAGALAWRDSLTLGIVNILCVLIALALAAARSRFGQLRIATMLDYTLDSLLASVYTMIGSALLLLNDIGWREIPRTGLTRQAVAVARGLLIGIPLVIFFGVLLMAADAVFQGMTEGIFRWLFSDVISHLALAGVLFWLVGGLLRFALMEQDRVRVAGDGGVRKPLGIVEAAIVLAMLDALFLAFVVVQFRYFFGGAAMVGGTPDLTFAEYARRGFFELVTVAALMLPLLLAADWAVHRRGATQERIFRLLVVALVALLFVVMASALQRMRLYQTEFGMTELRLYTTVFMGWIGLVFLWFLATVMRARREQFAAGMLVAGFLSVAFLNVINPDALIVGINVNRVKAEQPLDGRYVASLSADAVPALIALLPEIPEKERKAIAANILERWPTAPTPDWRSWNWGRAQARSAVLANEKKLEELVFP